MRELKRFLVPDPMKEHVLAAFESGFVSHFEYNPPAPWGPVKNYGPVTSSAGRRRLRSELTKQVLAGNMIGGVGWVADDVRKFFGGKEFYGIPCSATPKGTDPLGHIVHDYGYHAEGSYSVNATHSCTSVKYPTFKEVASTVDGVTWLIKADLKSGYRQFGAHPVD